MRDNVLHIKNLSDGKEVATAIGLYVNSFTTPGEMFYELMLTKDRNIQHNFTMLCLEWFRTLANYQFGDLRCKASIGYAVTISYHLRHETISRQKMSSAGFNKECDFYYRDDSSAAALIESYLRLSENNNAFIAQMLHEHKTNIQSFSRLCCDWFKVLEKEPSRYKRYVSLARKAAKYYNGFPMI